MAGNRRRQAGSFCRALNHGPEFARQRHGPRRDDRAPGPKSCGESVLLQYVSCISPGAVSARTGRQKQPGARRLLPGGRA